jgi:hypothetical protein
MNIVRSGSVSEPHSDFTTGRPCVVPPRCDAQGAHSGKTCPNPAVQWQDVQNPNLLLHAHVCQEHRALKATTADKAGRDHEVHSWLYRTFVHPLVGLAMLIVVATKIIGLW